MLRVGMCVAAIAVFLFNAALARAGTPQQSNQAASGPIRYLDNGQIRLGINLDLGGSITYLGKSGTEVNLINSYDWGRQIQMSNYSGPVPFAPNGKQPRKDWAGLGWNPIQSGDCYGNRSRITYFHSDGKQIVVRCIPMQWPLNNEPGECEFECRITLDGNAAHVMSSLQNHRSDQTQWDARDQELPAIYTNGPWYRLMTYEGDSPFTNAPLTQAPAAFPWTGWSATENWAALVDESGFGVGIYEPGITHFIGGFAGEPGKGGPKDGPTGYIAPLHVEILDHNIHYTYSYDLIVGDLTQIRGYVYAHKSRHAPPQYTFTKDRQHWRYVNAVDAGWPINGELKVSVAKANPQLIGPPEIWRADSASIIHVRAAFPAGISKLRVFWSRFDAPGFSETCVRDFAVSDDGAFHDYRFDLGQSKEYRGMITGVRLDPETNGLPGSFARFQIVKLEK